MLRIPIWNSNKNKTTRSRFCDAVVDETGETFLEIKFDRNNYQEMPLQEIQKQILDGIKKAKRK